MDECALPGVCLHGRCVNLDGTHQCICDTGYRVTPDSRTCEGLQNIIWRFFCISRHTATCCSSCCYDRGVMSTNHLFSSDVDECAAGNACHSGICINNPGSYTCQDCRQGFKPSADGLQCEGALFSASVFFFLFHKNVHLCLLMFVPAVFSDVNECVQGDLCQGGVCVNTHGSYTCTRCKAGYRLSQDWQRCEGKSCPSSGV